MDQPVSHDVPDDAALIHEPIYEFGTSVVVDLQLQSMGWLAAHPAWRYTREGESWLNALRDRPMCLNIEHRRVNLTPALDDILNQMLQDHVVPVKRTPGARVLLIGASTDPALRLRLLYLNRVFSPDVLLGRGFEETGSILAGAVLHLTSEEVSVFDVLSVLWPTVPYDHLLRLSKSPLFASPYAALNERYAEVAYSILNDLSNPELREAYYDFVDLAVQYGSERTPEQNRALAEAIENVVTQCLACGLPNVDQIVTSLGVIVREPYRGKQRPESLLLEAAIPLMNPSDELEEILTLSAAKTLESSALDQAPPIKIQAHKLPQLKALEHSSNTSFTPSVDPAPQNPAQPPHEKASNTMKQELAHEQVETTDVNLTQDAPLVPDFQAVLSADEIDDTADLLHVDGADAPGVSEVNELDAIFGPKQTDGVPSHQDVLQNAPYEGLIDAAIPDSEKPQEPARTDAPDSLGAPKSQIPLMPTKAQPKSIHNGAADPPNLWNGLDDLVEEQQRMVPQVSHDSDDEIDPYSPRPESNISRSPSPRTRDERDPSAQNRAWDVADSEAPDREVSDAHERITQLQTRLEESLKRAELAEEELKDILSDYDRSNYDRSGDSRSSDDESAEELDATTVEPSIVPPDGANTQPALAYKMLAERVSPEDRKILETWALRNSVTKRHTPLSSVYSDEQDALHRVGVAVCELPSDIVRADKFTALLQLSGFEGDYTKDRDSRLLVIDMLVGPSMGSRLLVFQQIKSLFPTETAALWHDIKTMIDDKLANGATWRAAAELVGRETIQEYFGVRDQDAPPPAVPTPMCTFALTLLKDPKLADDFRELAYQMQAVDIFDDELQTVQRELAQFAQKVNINGIDQNAVSDLACHLATGYKTVTQWEQLHLGAQREQRFKTSQAQTPAPSQRAATQSTIPQPASPRPAPQQPAPQQQPVPQQPPSAQAPIATPPAIVPPPSAQQQPVPQQQPNAQLPIATPPAIVPPRSAQQPNAAELERAKTSALPRNSRAMSLLYRLSPTTSAPALARIRFYGKGDLREEHFNRQYEVVSWCTKQPSLLARVFGAHPKHYVLVRSLNEHNAPLEAFPADMFTADTETPRPLTEHEIVRILPCESDCRRPEGAFIVRYPTLQAPAAARQARPLSPPEAVLRSVFGPGGLEVMPDNAEGGYGSELPLLTDAFEAARAVDPQYDLESGNQLRKIAGRNFTNFCDAVRETIAPPRILPRALQQRFLMRTVRQLISALVRHEERLQTEPLLEGLREYTGSVRRRWDPEKHPARIKIGEIIGKKHGGVILRVGDTAYMAKTSDVFAQCRFTGVLPQDITGDPEAVRNHGTPRINVQFKKNPEGKGFLIYTPQLDRFVPGYSTPGKRIRMALKDLPVFDRSPAVFYQYRKSNDDMFTGTTSPLWVVAKLRHNHRDYVVAYNPKTQRYEAFDGRYLLDELLSTSKMAAADQRLQYGQTIYFARDERGRVCMVRTNEGGLGQRENQKDAALARLTAGLTTNSAARTPVMDSPAPGQYRVWYYDPDAKRVVLLDGDHNAVAVPCDYFLKQHVEHGGLLQTPLQPHAKITFSHTNGAITATVWEPPQRPIARVGRDQQLSP